MWGSVLWGSALTCLTRLLAGKVLALLVEAAPCLVRLSVQGVTSETTSDAICAAWHARSPDTNASVLTAATGMLQLWRGAPSEASNATAAPRQHVLPSPPTPPTGNWGEHSTRTLASSEVRAREALMSVFMPEPCRPSTGVPLVQPCPPSPARRVLRWHRPRPTRCPGRSAPGRGSRDLPATSPAPARVH